MNIEFSMIRCFDETEATSEINRLTAEGWVLHSWQPTTCLGVEGAPTHSIFIIFYKAPEPEEGDNSKQTEAMAMVG